MSSTRPICWRLPDDVYAPVMKHACALAGFRSGLSVPMVRDQQVVGAITVNRAEVGRYADKEVALLQTFARQAVVAVQNVRLFNETKEALEQQTATTEVLDVISQSMADATPVFEKIVDRCEALFPAHAFGLALVDEQGQVHLPVMRVTARAIATLGAAKAAEVEAATRAAFPRPLAGTLTERAIRSGKLVVIRDASAEAAANADQPGVQSARRMDLGDTIILAPLMWKGKGIGSLTMMRPSTLGGNERDHALLQTFANQAVVALQNARLFNETKEALERQTATADVLQVISGSMADAQPVFERILASAEDLFDANVLGVYLVSEDQQVHPAAIRGEYKEHIAAHFPIALEGSATAAAIALGHVVSYADVLNSPRVPAGLRKLAQGLGINYALAQAPMMWQGRGIGAINVARLDMRPFSEKECGLLETFANQAVIAIQNARLFNETKEALERQTATADVLKVIAGSPSDVRPVFDAIASSSKRLLAGFSTTVFRIVDGVLHLEAFTPTNAAADAWLVQMFPRPIAEFPPFAMVSAGRISHIADTEADAGVPELLRDIARRRGYRAMLFTPLMREAEVIGMISVTREAPGPFAEHHEQLLRTFADQAVIAIENVRLFNETKEALEQQRHLGRGVEGHQQLGGRHGAGVRGHRSRLPAVVQRRPGGDLAGGR